MLVTFMSFLILVFRLLNLAAKNWIKTINVQYAYGIIKTIINVKLN